MTHEQWMTSHGFTKVPSADGEQHNYDCFYTSPNGQVVTERIAREQIENEVLDLLPVPAWRRREDRKFFAGLAMRALIQQYGPQTDGSYMRTHIAEEAVAMADAILAALEPPIG